MKTPEYRFLMGSPLQGLTLTAGYYYDLQTGQRTVDQTGQWYATLGDAATIADSWNRRFVLTDTRLANSSYVSVYDSERNYLGSQDLRNSYIDPSSLPEGTAHIAVTLSKADYERVRDLSSLLYVMLEVEPFYSTLGKTVERQSGQIFFRETLDTDLHFVGELADALLAIANASIGRRFALACQRRVFSTTWLTYHVDTFSTLDCQFDAARHICTPTLTPLDRYTKITARQSDEHDLIKLNPEIIQIETSLRPIIEIYERGSSVITRFLGGTYWETEVSEPIDDESVLRGTEHFGQRPVSDAAGYMEVEFDSGWAAAAGVPSGVYKFDRSNNYYFLQDGTDFWAWSFATFQGAEFLALSKNGAPFVESLTGYPILAWVPTSVSSASDLPVPSDYGTTYEITRAANYGTVGFVKYRLYDLWIRAVGNADTLFGTASFDLPKDDFAVDSPAYKKCAPLDKNQGYFYLTDDTTTEPTEFGITENGGEYYTRENLPVEGGIDGVKPMPVGKHEWGKYSFWYNYDDNYATQEAASRYDYLLRDCFTLGSVVKALLKEIDPAITFEETRIYSEFLYSNSAPNHMTSDYGWRLAITPKSNVLKGDYDQPAQKAPITFEGFMRLLQEQYDLYWYIDNQYNLHIEHKLYFLNGGSYIGASQVQLDFTGDTLRDKFNRKRTAYFQNAFSYDTSLLRKRLEMGTAENGTEFFTGLSFDFNADYAKFADTQAVTVGDFTADIDLMRIEPSRYSQDGFALLAYETVGTKPKVNVGTLKVTDHEGGTRVAFVNNSFASWLFCQHLHLYDAASVAFTAYLRLVGLASGAFADTVRGLVWAKRQEIQFPSDQDPDTLQLITTDVGSGMPERFEINALTRQVKATLSFPIGEVPIN